MRCVLVKFVECCDHKAVILIVSGKNLRSGIKFQHITMIPFSNLKLKFYPLLPKTKFLNVLPSHPFDTTCSFVLWLAASETPLVRDGSLWTIIRSLWCPSLINGVRFMIHNEGHNSKRSASLIWRVYFSSIDGERRAGAPALVGCFLSSLPCSCRKTWVAW